MDAFDAIRLKAEEKALKRAEKRGTPLPEFARPQKKVEEKKIQRPVKDSLKTTIAVRVHAGFQLFQFDLEAPNFFGTIMKTKINEKDLKEMIVNGLSQHFGKLK